MIWSPVSALRLIIASPDAPERIGQERAITSRSSTSKDTRSTEGEKPAGLRRSAVYAHNRNASSGNIA
jgi:hypothetical protein